MSSLNKSLLTAGTAVLVLIALYFALTCIQDVRIERELVSQYDEAAVVSEINEAKLRLEHKELEEAAEKYREAKEAMAQRAERRIKAYNDALLTFVNPWNEIDGDYVPCLTTVEDGFQVDRRCAEALSRMLFDCRQEGHFPLICSAFRTWEYQRMLFDRKLQRVVETGVGIDEAPEIAARSVAVPGTSEHQLGLAVDLIDYFYTNLDEGQERTETQKWLMENCSDYGFILRYPNGTTEITGIIYEPWHYRYVGKSAAKEITGRGITLEEYLSN